MVVTAIEDYTAEASQAKNEKSPIEITDYTVAKSHIFRNPT